MTEGAFRIGSSHLRAEFAPDHGGRMLRLDARHGNDWTPLMPEPGSPPYLGRKATAFPLIPFGGRLLDASFEWNADRLRLPPWPEGTRHTLHGDGQRRVWDVVDRGATHVVLSCEWPTADWPFPATTTMRFGIAGRILTMRQDVVSRSDEPIPFALGWHPYLRAGSGTELRMSAASVAWLDAEGIAGPRHRIDIPVVTQRCDRSGTAIYELTDGRIHLSNPGHTPHLTFTLSSAFRHVAVHAPSGTDVVAIEPMTHPPHRPESCEVPPKGHLFAECRIEVHPQTTAGRDVFGFAIGSDRGF